MVQQILDTKKELEDGAKPKNKGVEIERESGISDFNRQRERESTQREIQKLKDSIQVKPGGYLYRKKGEEQQKKKLKFPLFYLANKEI